MLCEPVELLERLASEDSIAFFGGDGGGGMSEGTHLLFALFWLWTAILRSGCLAVSCRWAACCLSCSDASAAAAAPDGMIAV